MSGDRQERALGRAAEHLRDEPTVLSGWLPTDPDGREILRDKLELDQARMNRLLLCRPPLPSSFRADVQAIARYLETEPVPLAEGLRLAAALGALWQVFHSQVEAEDEELLEAASIQMPMPMLAARDAAAETIALEPAPRERLRELADKFWSDAGQRDGSRDLNSAVAVALPLAVTNLPRLGLSSVTSWLGAYGVDYDPGEPDRPLRGLLIATRGLGLVFLDGSLPEPDRRFTLAHEIGHFLLDYLEPRRRVLREMPELAPVVDGERPPTRTERARALLQRLPIGTYTRAIERDPSGGASDEVEVMEDEATLFAMELLAPWDQSVAMTAQAAEGLSRFDEALGAATNALATGFKLPNEVARARARACLAEIGRHRGLFDR